MTDEKRSRLEKASWIAGILGTLVAVLAFAYEMHKPKEDSGPVATQTAGNNSTQIGNVWGNVVIGQPDSTSQPGTSAHGINDRYIYRGVTASFAAYNTNGMVGIESAVENCYASIDARSTMDQVKQCLASDLTGLYWDRGMDAAMGFPPIEYFAEDKVLNRVSAAFTRIRIDKSLWQRIVFNGWLPQIQSQYQEIAENETFDSIKR